MDLQFLLTTIFFIMALLSECHCGSTSYGGKVRTTGELQLSKGDMAIYHLSKEIDKIKLSQALIKAQITKQAGR